MRLFTKLFILSALAFLLPLGARALTAPAALWLNGDTDIPGAGSGGLTAMAMMKAKNPIPTLSKKPATAFS